MSEPAHHRVAQAEALLNSDMLREAFADLEADALARILSADGEGADRVRREAADLIKVVREVPHMLRVKMASAKSELAAVGKVA